MALYCTPKLNTLVKHSRQLLEHTYTSDPLGLGTPTPIECLPTGPLVAIFQHSLQFLQSESFQTHVGTIHRWAIGPLAHHNGTSAYSPALTCHLQAPTIGCLHSNISLSTLISSRIPKYHSNVSNCCQHNNAANYIVG
jgi:hypothetical protein